MADTVDRTANGALSTWSENNGFGSVDGPQNKLGRAAGHALSLLQSGVEIYSGASAIVGGGGEAVATAPAATTGVGVVVPAVGVATVIGGVVTVIHGGAVGVNTLVNIFSKGKDSHPAKDTSTVQGATDQVDDIQANQANQRKVGHGDAIESTKKSEQQLDTNLKKIKSQKDAPVE